MAKLTLVVGALTEERILTDARMQAIINAYLGKRAYVDIPDPQTGQVVRTELTNPQKLSLFADSIQEHIMTQAKQSYQQVKNLQSQEVARQESEAIKWQ